MYRNSEEINFFEKTRYDWVMYLASLSIGGDFFDMTDNLCFLLTCNSLFFESRFLHFSNKYVFGGRVRHDC